MENSLVRLILIFTFSFFCCFDQIVIAQDIELELLKDIEAGEDGSFVSRFNDQFYPLQDILLFVASTAEKGIELWRTDGTTDGTFILMDINPGEASSLVSEVTIVGEMAYFYADDGVHGFELWITDGFEEGTRMVKDINPGMANGYRYNSSLRNNAQVVFQDKMYFAMDSETGFNELWVTDGTEEGTQFVQTVCPNCSETNQSFNHLIVLDSFMYFVTGLDFWKSDGTTEGTVEEDLGLPTFLGKPTVIDSLMIWPNDFSGIWISDGTIENTVEINSNLRDLSDFTEFNGDLYFTAAGSKLYRLELDSFTITQPFEGPVLSNSLFVFADKLFFGSSARLQSTDGSFDDLVEEIIISTELSAIVTEKQAFFLGRNSDGFEVVMIREINGDYSYVDNPEWQGYEPTNLALLNDKMILYANDRSGPGWEPHMFSVESTVSLNATQNWNELSLSPNPATNHLKIEGTFDRNGTEYTIWDLQGNMISTGIMNRTTIDIGGVSPGKYILLIQQLKSRRFGKFVKFN